MLETKKAEVRGHLMEPWACLQMQIARRFCPGDFFVAKQRIAVVPFVAVTPHSINADSKNASR
jgi:hypothetical protein